MAKKTSGDEELLQRGYIGKQINQNIKTYGKGKYVYYSLGSTTIKTLQDHGLIPQGNYKEILRRKPDGLIVNRANEQNVVAVIENKPSSSVTAQDGLRQACEVGYSLNAPICIFFNGHSTEVVVPTDSTGGYQYLLDKFGRKIQIDFTNDIQIEQLINNVETNLVGCAIVDEPAKNPSKLARNIWQLTWQLTKQNPTRALATFVECFMFKYLSDLGVLTTDDSSKQINFDYLYKEHLELPKTGQKNTKDTCLLYYKETIRPYIKNKLFPMEANGDGTTILNGFVFDDKNKDHRNAFYQILEVFDKEGKLKNIDKEFKSRLFEDFLKNMQSVKGLGQYFTPRIVMKAIIDMADVRNTLSEGANVNDPACGVGGFLLETMAERKGDFYFEMSKETGKYELKNRINYYGFDVANGQEQNDNLTIILAKANFIIYLADLLKNNKDFTTEFAKQFNRIFWSYNKTSLGSLSEVNIGMYDLTISNPPYVTNGSAIIKKLIEENGLSMLYCQNGEGLEGLFLEKIVRELKPNGAAFVILPDGIINRDSDKQIRNFVLDECYLDAVLSLPNKTFYTTQKKTYIIAIRKKPVLDSSLDGGQLKQNHPVLNFLITDIGETLDSYRLKTETGNLNDAVKNFKIFKTVYINKFSDDVDNNEKLILDYNGLVSLPDRLKLVDVDSLRSNSWSCENHYSHDELVRLGVKDGFQIDDMGEAKTKMIEIRQTMDALIGRLENLEGLIKNGFNYKPIKLSKIFDFDKGKPNSGILTKEFCHNKENRGHIPVYSATKEESKYHGKIKDKIQGIKYYQDCLTITKNGTVGILYYRDHKFAATSDVLPLLIQEEHLATVDYHYMKEAVTEYLIDKEYNWSKKLNADLIKQFEIKIPVDDNGLFDLKAQKDIVRVKHEISSITEELTEVVSQFKNTYYSPIKVRNTPRM